MPTSRTPPIHRHTAWGQWAVVLLQCTASLAGGSRQLNRCNALPHYLSAVGSATPVMHCLTAWGQWAVELLHRHTSLGQWAVEPLQWADPTAEVIGSPTEEAVAA